MKNLQGKELKNINGGVVYTLGSNSWTAKPTANRGSIGHQ